MAFYANEFNASPSLIGLLLTSNAAAQVPFLPPIHSKPTQMISAPIIGRASDRYGRY
jgi:MFS family permease